MEAALDFSKFPKYQGREGYELAMQDVDEMRQRIVQHLLNTPPIWLSANIPEMRNKQLDEINIAGLSYYLIKGAATEEDVGLIRDLNSLIGRVLYHGNAVNFTEPEEHVLMTTIRRETSAFLVGWNLAHKLLQKG